MKSNQTNAVRLVLIFKTYFFVVLVHQIKGRKKSKGAQPTQNIFRIFVVCFVVSLFSIFVVVLEWRIVVCKKSSCIEWVILVRFYHSSIRTTTHTNEVESLSYSSFLFGRNSFQEFVITKVQMRQGEPNLTKQKTCRHMW